MRPSVQARGAHVLLSAALAVVLAGLACAGSGAPAKPAATAGSVDVEYEGGAPARAAAAKPTIGLEFWTGRKDLIQAPPPPKPEELTLPKVERFSLKNGLEVIVVPRKELPLASFSLSIEAGGYDESRDVLGVSDFVAAMLRRGTKTRSADDISRAIDFVGGSLDARASNDGTTASCAALSKDAPLCLDLLADIVLRPSFPEAEMAEVRDQMLAGIAARFDSPHELSMAHFSSLLFGEKNPEGWVLTAEDVNRLTRAQLEAFWRTFYRPNRAILAVAGDVDISRLRTAIDKAFGAWARAKVPARPGWTVPPVAGTSILLVDREDLTQATMVLGHQGIKHADPRWYAATLTNYVLGGSDFSSRLMIEVRSKLGLTYGIGSSFGASLYEGAFRVTASTKNGSAWEALLATVNQIRKMQAAGPTTGELDKAKGFYAGSYPFKLQTAGGVASALVAAEQHGLSASYVRELPVRLAAVDQPKSATVAGELLHPDTLLVVIVGKASAIEPQLAGKGIAYQRINFKDPISAAARAAAKAKQPAPAAAPPAK